MSARGRGFWTAWLIRIALAAAVAGVFSPLFSAQFLKWDDGQNLFENPRMLPPSWSNCAYYWSHANLSLYIPVTYTVWSGLAAVSQEPGDATSPRTLNPAIFHITNVVLHALAAIVVFNILRKWTADPAAAAGALIFAIHPMQVEAVGWVCGMKDVLAGMLGLIAIWQYLLHVAGPSRWFSRHYLAGSAAFVLATLSKPSAVVTPLVCAIIAIGIARIPWRRVMLEMTSWLCVSAAVAIIAAEAQPAPYGWLNVPIWGRPLIATDALAFYLHKLVWPVALCLDYGRRPSSVLNATNGHAYCAWVIPLSIGALLWWKRKQWPRVGIAALVSLAALLPVLGLVRFNFQSVSTVTDHYFYFAMLGPAIATASLLQARRRSLAVIALAASVITVLGVLSHAQTYVWTSESATFEHVVEVNPRSEIGHSHIWQLDIYRRNLSAAESEARIVISCNPADSSGYIDLGDTLSDTDRWSEAAEAYVRAIQLDPDNPVAYNDLAGLYGSHGDPARAIPLYRKALELKPDYVEAKIGLETAVNAEAGETRAHRR